MIGSAREFYISRDIGPLKLIRKDGRNATSNVPTNNVIGIDSSANLASAKLVKPFFSKKSLQSPLSILQFEIARSAKMRNYRHVHKFMFGDRQLFTPE